MVYNTVTTNSNNTTSTMLNPCFVYIQVVAQHKISSNNILKILLTNVVKTII